MTTENSAVPSIADIAAVTRNNNSGMGWGGDWMGYIVLFLVVSMFGWGGNGLFGGGAQGAANNYVLSSDFASLQRQIDSGVASLERKGDAINSGLCDGFYAMNSNFGTLNTTLCQGFGGVTNAVTQNGYETRLGIGDLKSQIASCCCDVREGITGVNYNLATQVNGLSRQMSDCCCDVEKMNMQNRFDAQAYNCNTLQAIDKLGDRIDSRLNEMENARVREQLDAERTKNAVLQGQIDRTQLRYDIVNDVRPCPHSAFLTCNPYASIYSNGYGYNNNNGCGCNNNYGYSGCGCNCNA